MLTVYAKRFWSMLRRDPALLTLLVLATAYFLLYYVTDPALPSAVYQSLLGFHDKALYPNGWFGYYDQGQYLQLAHTLASLHFNQLHQTFSYGLGYPLVAVPLIWLGFNADPFVAFDLFVFVFATFATYQTAKKLISPLAGWLAGFGLVFATPLIHYVDQPWNSTVCLLTMSGILLAATAGKIKKWHALTLGFLVGWAFAARYVDVIWLGALAMAALYRSSVKSLVKPCIFMAIGALIWAVPVLYAQDRIFGSPFRTPYVNHIGIGGQGGSDQGLAAYSLKRVPSAAEGMFISPRLAGSRDVDRGLLVDMFWVVAAIPGAVILLKRKQRRLFFSIFIGAVTAASLFYLSFRASTAGSIKYGVLHYFKMFWPGLVILAVAFFDDLLRSNFMPKTSAAVQPRSLKPSQKKQRPRAPSVN